MLEEELEVKDGEHKSTFKNNINNFLKKVDELKINYEEFSKDTYNIICKKIDESSKIRDLILESLNNDIDNDNYRTEYIFEFFEGLLKTIEVYNQTNNVSNKSQNDHISFLTFELFLSTITILLKRKMYSQIYELLNSAYFVEYPYGESKYYNFPIFRCHCKSLQEKNNIEKLNRISLQTDMLIERINTNFFQKEDLLETDLLLTFLSETLLLNKSNDISNFYKWWFPTTIVYNRNNKIVFLKKLYSKRFCNEIINLFGVKTIEELKNLLIISDKNSKINYTSRGYGFSFETAPYISEIIDFEKIGTID